MNTLKCWFSNSDRSFVHWIGTMTAVAALLSVAAACSSNMSEQAASNATEAGGTGGQEQASEPGSPVAEAGAPKLAVLDDSVRAFIAHQQAQPPGDLSASEGGANEAPDAASASQPLTFTTPNKVLDLPGSPPAPTTYPISADGKYYNVNLLFRNFLPPTASATFGTGASQLGAAAPPLVFDGRDAAFTAVTSVPGDPQATVTLTVDMGQYFSIGAVRPLYSPFGGAGQYPFSQRVRLATKLGAQADWKTVVESPTVSADTTLSFDATPARYLELTMLGNGGNLLELFVYPSAQTSPPPTSASGYDLSSLGATSTVNSNFYTPGSVWPMNWPAGSFYPKPYGVATGDAVGTVDLGAQYPVSRLSLGFFWSTPWAKGGRLEVAATSDTYTTIYDSGAGQSFPTLRDFSFPTQLVRYIRATDYFIPGTGPSAGVLWSVQAFANAAQYVGYYPLSADGKYFGVNLLRHRTDDIQPTASVVYSNGAVPYVYAPLAQIAANAIDGDDRSFSWSAAAGTLANATTTLTVDLGQVQLLGAVRQLYGGYRPLSSSVRVAETLAGPWNQVLVDTPVTGADSTSSFDQASARYVELTMKGTTATGFVNLLELQVYPSSATDPAPSSGSHLDLSYLTGMSITPNANMGTSGVPRIDSGAIGYYVKTAALGATGDGTITLDLGQQYQISELGLSWYSNQTWPAGGKVDVDDGSGNWLTVFDSGRGSPLGPAADGPQRISFAPHVTRYVRLTGYFDPAVAPGLLEGIEVFGDNAPCVASCASKQCGDDLSDGCGGSCPGVCGTNQVGCALDSDCQSGLVCLGTSPGSSTRNTCIVPGIPCASSGDCSSGNSCGNQNGADFGLAASTDVCVPSGCLSMDPSTNPCADPTNAGKQTSCGACPVCVPQCDGKSCGDDHCGGSCGTCADGATCLGGVCLGTPNELDSLNNGPIPRADVTPPTTEVFNGTVPGAIPASFAINDNGQATYHTPLTVPPGRGGLQPTLALDYNSAAGNGILGQGWSLEGLSAIDRCDKTIPQDGVVQTPRYQDGSAMSELDAFCLDGQRLIPINLTASTVEFRTEVEQFSRVIGNLISESGPQVLESFQVKTKTGFTYEYGGTSDSRVVGASSFISAPQTYLLDKVTDLAGNTMRYSYEQDSVTVGQSTASQALISTIAYGWHDDEASSSAGGLVQFNYASRSDPLSGWKNGGLETVNKALSYIEMESTSGAFRRYAMNYSVAGLLGSDNVTHGRTTLTDVLECARSPNYASWTVGPGECKKPIHFDYSSVAPPVVAAPISENILYYPSGDVPEGFAQLTDFPESNQPTEPFPLDLNGDGRTDFLIAVTHQSPRGLSSDETNCQGPEQEPGSSDGCWSEWALVLSQPNGTYISKDTGIPTESALFTRPTRGNQSSFIFSWGRLCPGSGVVVDFNNDGRDELLETNCDDEGFFQTSFSLLTFDDATQNVKRVDMPNVPYGPLGSSGPLKGGTNPDVSTPQSAQYVLDADGDGAKDLLECHGLTTNSPVWTLFVNKHGTDVSDPFFFPGSVVPLNLPCNAAGSGTFNHTVLDVDGDGRDELIIRNEPAAGGEQQQEIVRLSFDAARNVTVAIAPTNLAPLPDRSLLSPKIPPYKVMDANGDGLADLVSVQTNSSLSTPGLLELSRGDGTFDQYSLPQFSSGWPGAIENDDAVFRAGAVVDVNGDGMQDLVVPGNPSASNPVDRQWVWFRSTGTGFVKEQFPNPIQTSNTNIFFDSVVVADTNGDGLPELVSARMDLTWPQLQLTTPPAPEINAITDSLGARTLINYQPLKYQAVAGPTFYTPGTCSYPQHCEELSPRRVASSVQTWDEPAASGFVPVRESDYTYQDARTDLARRDWLGFAHRTVQEFIDPVGTRRLISTLDIYHDLDSYDSTVQIFPFAHLQSSTSELLTPGSSQALFTTQNTWQSRIQGSRGILIWLGSSLEAQTEGTTAPDQFLDSQHTASIDPPDQYGNVVHRSDSWGGQSDRDVVSTENRDSTFTYEWQTTPAFESNWLIGQVHNVTVTSSTPDSVQSLSKTRSETFGYFDNGLLETVQRNGSVTEQRSSTLARNSYGAITSITNADLLGNTRSVSIGYDGVGFAPTSVTNGKGQVTQVAFDARFGTLTQSIDPNLLTTTTYFDDFGRTREVVRPDNTFSTISYTPGPSTTSPLRVTSSELGGEVVDDDFDVLGRSVTTTRTALQGSVVQNQVYDQRGFVIQVERPHKSTLTGAPLTAFTNYDDLGRPTLGTDPNGGIYQFCYEERRACQTNPNGFTSCKVHDALGRVTRSIDPTFEREDCGTALAASVTRAGTTYVYGPFGDLSTVTDTQGNVTTAQTDEYGRRISLTDPDSGTTSYGFDGLDEVTTQDDQNLNHLSFFYDSLGRLFQRQEGEPGRVTTLIWDKDADGATDPLFGQLSSVLTSDGHNTSYHYDSSSGHLTSIDQAVAGQGGGTFHVGFDYDDSARLSDVTYPQAPGRSLLQVHHVYDAHGHLTNVQDATNSVLPLAHNNFWSIDPNTATDDYDQLHAETFGNGATTLRGYNPNGRLTSINTTIGSQVLQDLQYTLDANGNVLNRIDFNHGQAEAFGYDQLDRLRCSRATSGSTDPLSLDGCPGPVDANYQYDDLGRLQNGPAGTYSYFVPTGPGFPIHAAWSAGQTGYQYDNNGNRTVQSTLGVADRHYAWSALNQLTDVWDEGASSTDKVHPVHFEYNGSDTRVRKETDSLVTAYVDSLYEMRTSKTGGATEHVYYVSNGERTIAQVSEKEDSSPPAVSYLHVDNLGSTHVVTDGDGNLLDERSYDAFGNARSTDWTQGSLEPAANGINFGFTSQERDLEVDLVNMRGREYDSKIGQFLQSDPMVQDPLSSQSLNRYSYVLNNPLRFIDPSGFDPTASAGIDDTHQMVWVEGGKNDRGHWENPDGTIKIYPATPKAAAPAGKSQHSANQAHGGAAQGATHPAPEPSAHDAKADSNTTGQPSGPAPAAPTPGAGTPGTPGPGPYTTLGALEGYVPFGTLGSDLSPPPTARDRFNLGVGQVLGSAAALSEIAGGLAAAGGIAAATGIGGPLAAVLEAAAAAAEIASVVAGVGVAVNAATGVYNMTEGAAGGGAGASGGGGGGGPPQTLDPGTTPVYRGGTDMTARPGQYRVGPDGMVKTTHGISLNTNPARLERFGGANQVKSVPNGLQIIQRGADPGHFEIVPSRPMTPGAFQGLLNQVVLH